MTHSHPTQSRSTDLLFTKAQLDNGTDGLRGAFHERLEKDCDRLLRTASDHVEHLIREAYIAGVRDGFVQGAEAQARLELQAEGLAQRDA